MYFLKNRKYFSKKNKNKNLKKLKFCTIKSIQSNKI